MIKIIALLTPLLINLFSTIFLFSFANKKYKNRFFLGLFFFNSFLLFIGHFLTFNEYWIAFKYFDFIFLASLLAFYPFYYLYVFSVFNFNIKSTKWLFHFIPSIIIGFAMLIATSLSSSESYEIYMNNSLYNTDLTDQFSKALAYLYNGSRTFHLLQILVYNFLGIQLLLKSRDQMRNSFSNIDKYQLRYFYIVNILFILIMSIPVFYITLVGISPFNTNEILLFILCSIFTAAYIILAIIGMKQFPVEYNLGNTFTSQNNKELHQYELKQIESKLLDYFYKEKPWLSSNLNIWDVAKNIGSNRSYLSHVINENLGCNFNYFVNNYRVKEAKLLLKQTPDLYLSEISELSGFGSVNSFIRIFKMIEKCTPSEFKTNNF